MTAARRLKTITISVRGMLCFVDADWPLIGGSFTVHGIGVVSPKRAARQICDGDELAVETVIAARRVLRVAFPAHTAGA